MHAYAWQLELAIQCGKLRESMDGLVHFNVHTPVHACAHAWKWPDPAGPKIARWAKAYYRARSGQDFLAR
jgi:hypothetical protein